MSNVLVPDRPDNKPYTKQEVVDKVYDWIFIQNKPMCVVGFLQKYRDLERTTACTIGCLIPDSMYPKILDGNLNPSISYILESGFWRRKLSFSKLFSIYEIEFYEDIESIHADCTYINEVNLYKSFAKARLESICDEYGLVMPEGNN